MEAVPNYMTLPYELEFLPSAAEPHQIGVWSKCAIRKDELYGPFLGERRKVSEVFDGTYSWEIRGPKGRRLFSIDATNPINSNWMRYVKSARFYEEQNMIAVQEDRNIFYKALRKIPSGEELLCWYKGDTSSTSLPLKSRLKKSYTTHNRNIPAVRIWKDNGGTKRKYENTSKIRNGNKVISLLDHDISLSDLDEGLHKKSATCFSVNDTRSKRPVVKLIPLSAVHLNFETHPDSDVRETNVVPSAEDTKSKRTSTSYSVKQGLITGKRSNKYIIQSTETDSSIHSQTHAEKCSKQNNSTSTPPAIYPMTKCKELLFLKNDPSQSNNLPNTVCTFETKLQSDECHNGNKIGFETNTVLKLENVANVENQTTEYIDVETYTNPKDYSNGQKIPFVENVILCPDKTFVNTLANINHVHLKIQSSKVHVKHEKNIKGFVARKRDKIRTRSVSYSEKGIENSNIVKQNDGDFEMSSKKKDDDSIQEDNISNDTNTPYNTEIDISQHRKILRKPSDQVSSALVKKVSHITHYAKKNRLQCRCCKKIFKYNSWLTRHMMIHHPPSMTSTIKQVGIEKPNPEKREIDQYELKQDVTAENKECDLNKITYKSPTRKSFTDKNISRMKKVKSSPCSYCSQHFTTNKNCRRQKGLVHNIPVRPEKNKLTNSNYIVEKKTTSNYVERSDISTSLQRKTKKAQNIHKVSRVPARKRDSSHVSVGLFDPLQMKQSDLNRCNSIPSSHRAGPPTVAKKCLKNNSGTTDQNIQYQGTLFPCVSLSTNPCQRSGKPDPFVPKKSTRRIKNALFSEEDYDSSVSLLTANQIIYSAPGIRTTNMDTNQPIDLSFRSKTQKNDTNTSSFSGLFSISPNGENTQLTNVTDTRGTFVNTNVFPKETFNFKTTNLEKNSDPVRSYSTSQVSNNGQKHQNLKQNYTTQRPVQGPQSQFETFKPILYQFQKLTSTDGASAEYMSRTLEAARLQKRMNTLFKPVLAEVKKSESQTYPGSNIAHPKVTYSCNVCSLQFLTLYLLSHHISNHADEWPYKCEFCIKLFRTPQDLVFHRKSQHLPCKIAPCKICRCKFANRAVLEGHYRIPHNSTETFKSNRLSTAHANIAKITSHVTYPQLQVSPTYRCTKCSMVFSKTCEFHSHIIDCALNGTDK